jgi:hypothetical protein
MDSSGIFSQAGSKLLWTPMVFSLGLGQLLIII